MEQWFLFGIALFAVIRITVDLFTRIFSFPIDLRGNIPKLILLTRNSQGNIEWVVRSYCHQRRLEGKSSEILCFDTGSTDDTHLILQRLQRRYPSLEVLPCSGAPSGCDEGMSLASAGGREALILDLRKKTRGR